MVDATDMANFRAMLSQAATLNIPIYVQVLANDVVNGNVANATYQGQKLGNLARAAPPPSSPSWSTSGPRHRPSGALQHLADLRATAGSLFDHAPSHLDEVQGTWATAT